MSSEADTPGDVYTFVVPKEGPYQAQHGEDRWLERFFNGKTSGTFVEVGAYDGIVFSNTFFFETRGWTGVLIEPDPEKAAQCRANRPKSRVFECAAVSSRTQAEARFFAVQGGPVFSTVKLTDEHRRRMSNYGLPINEIQVAAMTLDQILESAGLQTIDFVTIDVEEGEMEVLNGFDILRWRPEVVVVESNSRFRKPQIRRYFVEHGYVFHDSVEINDFYVPLRRHRTLTTMVDATSYGLHRAPKSISYALHHSFKSISYALHRAAKSTRYRLRALTGRKQ